VASQPTRDPDLTECQHLTETIWTCSVFLEEDWSQLIVVVDDLQGQQPLKKSKMGISPFPYIKKEYELNPLLS